MFLLTTAYSIISISLTSYIDIHHGFVKTHKTYYGYSYIHVSYVSMHLISTGHCELHGLLFWVAFVKSQLTEWYTYRRHKFGWH